MPRPPPLQKLRSDGDVRRANDSPTADNELPPPGISTDNEIRISFKEPHKIDPREGAFDIFSEYSVGAALGEHFLPQVNFFSLEFCTIVLCILVSSRLQDDRVLSLVWSEAILEYLSAYSHNVTSAAAREASAARLGTDESQRCYNMRRPLSASSSSAQKQSYLETKEPIRSFHFYLSDTFVVRRFRPVSWFRMYDGRVAKSSQSRGDITTADMSEVLLGSPPHLALSAGQQRPSSAELWRRSTGVESAELEAVAEFTTTKLVGSLLSPKNGEAHCSLPMFCSPFSFVAKCYCLFVVVGDFWRYLAFSHAFSRPFPVIHSIQRHCNGVCVSLFVCLFVCRIASTDVLPRWKTS